MSKIFIFSAFMRRKNLIIVSSYCVNTNIWRTEWHTFIGDNNTSGISFKINLISTRYQMFGYGLHTYIKGMHHIVRENFLLLIRFVKCRRTLHVKYNLMFIADCWECHISYCSRGRRGRDRMVVGFTITYAIVVYHHWCCGFDSRPKARCTTLCDKVCQWLAAGLWFSPGPPFLKYCLKVALSTIKPKPNLLQHM